jgi:hypothetical protein
LILLSLPALKQSSSFVLVRYIYGLFNDALSIFACFCRVQFSVD